MKFQGQIEYTCLSPTSLVGDVEALCKSAIQNNAAAVLVPPLFVKKALGFLLGSDVKVAAVIGYPLGYSAVEAKLAEILLSIVDGAEELDVVINYTAVKNNDWAYVANELNNLLSITRAKQKVIKIVLEAAVLAQDELLKCCDLYGVAGIDFMKVSTGFSGEETPLKTIRFFKSYLPSNVKLCVSVIGNNIEFVNQLRSEGVDRISCDRVAFVNGWVN